MEGQLTARQVTSSPWCELRKKRNEREQRTVIRYALQIPVTYSWVERGLTREAAGRTRDVSVRGAYVVSRDCPPYGASLRITMSFLRTGRKQSPQLMDGEGSVQRVERAPDAEKIGFVVESESERLFTRR